MKFSPLIFLFAFFSLSAAQPLFWDQYEGIFGNLCDRAAKKFSSFGTCISKIPEFQQLSSSFWYKAAKKGLCGVVTHEKMNDTQKLPINSFNREVLLPPRSALELLRMPENETTSELAAQYLFELSKMTLLVEFTEISKDDIKERGLALQLLGIDSSFGRDECLKLCDSIQQGSNELSECWSVFGLTVVYGVCEIGCRIYF